MSVSSESAEQLTKVMIEGSEVILKVTGSGAKNAIALIAAILKDNTQTRGKTRLSNMIKSGKDLKIFSVSNEDLKKFTSEAKRYGVLYSALVNKNMKVEDGIVDIMVRAEDAPKINRIVERFKIATADEAKIKTEIQKTKNGIVPLVKNQLENKLENSKRESVKEKINKIKEGMLKDNSKSKVIQKNKTKIKEK